MIRAALTCYDTIWIFFLLLVPLSNNRLWRLQPFGKRSEADNNLYRLQTVHKQERWRGVLVLSLSPVWPMVRRRAHCCCLTRSRRGCCDRWSWYETWLFTNMARNGNVLREMIRTTCQKMLFSWLRCEEVMDSVYGWKVWPYFSSFFTAVIWVCHATYYSNDNNEAKGCMTYMYASSTAVILLASSNNGLLHSGPPLNVKSCFWVRVPLKWSESGSVI